MKCNVFVWLLGAVVLMDLDAAAAENEPKAYFLSTNVPSYFCLNHGSGAIYYRFEPEGKFESIGREHMGIIPRSRGTWSQDSEGMLLLQHEKPKGRDTKLEKAKPMVYKEQVFLLWPEKSYGRDLGKVMVRIDGKGTGPRVYNEFMISEREFTNGTSKPYPFRHLREAGQKKP